MAGRQKIWVRPRLPSPAAYFKDSRADNIYMVDLVNAIVAELLLRTPDNTTRGRILMTSPNGSVWEVNIDNSGVVTTTLLIDMAAASTPLPTTSVTLNYESGSYLVDATAVGITGLLGNDPFGWGYNYNPTEIITGGLRTSGFQDPSNTPAFLAPVMHAINANPTGFALVTELTMDGTGLSGGYFWTDDTPSPSGSATVNFWAGSFLGDYYAQSLVGNADDSVHTATGTRQKIAVSFGPSGCFISVAGNTTLSASAGSWATMTWATPAVALNDNMIIHKQTFYLGIITGSALSALSA
jgi:hypothetical protein